MMEPIIRVAELRWLHSQFETYYKTHGRNYPWRRESNPYLILNTELVLQRTKADDVAAHWQTIKQHLALPLQALTSETQLETLFAQLGLSKRIAWILQIAEVVAEQGFVPSTLEELRKLPGVGFYTACATLAFAFNINEGLVDSNVIRLFERFWDPFPHHDLRQKVRFWLPVSKSIGGKKNIKSVYWGLLDLSGQICTPRNPACNACPLRTKCRTGRINLQASKSTLET